MKYLLSVLVAMFSGMLIFFGPVGIYILCVLIIGVIFRSFILINEIHKQVVPADSNDRVKEAYERYIKERNENETES